MSPSNRQTFRNLLNRRLNRRDLLVNGGLLAGSAISCRAWTQPAKLATDRPMVSPSQEDRVIVPDGYVPDVVLRWGDRLFPDSPEFDAATVAAGGLLEPGAAHAQERQFGTNCDGVGMFSHGADGVILCVNHEYVIPELMFPGWWDARRWRGLASFVRSRPEAVPFMQASVGLTVVELRYANGWRVVESSSLNRRVTANTEVVFGGPASEHPWLGTDAVAGSAAGLGTLGNCAAGVTPWGTYLTAEENVDDFFGNANAAEFDPQLSQAHRRFGLRLRDSAFRWEHIDERFDMAKHPTESLKFGWIVELDPRDPSVPIKKRTALGRFKHEGATTVLARDRRAVTYTGDDEAFEYLYKFVSTDRFDPERPERNRDLLDSGVLYVARFFDDGRGEWLPLVHDEHRELTPAHGFKTQGDVVLRCREAADRVGATPLDRPEDVAVNPNNNRVYFSCTQNLQRGQARDPDARQVDSSLAAVSPRGPNWAGHIIELIEGDDDAAARTFQWDVFLLAGDPRGGGLRVTSPLDDRKPFGPSETYFAGRGNAESLSAFANPDNLEFDGNGNLWIVTDGNQPGRANNGCFVCPTEGDERGAVRQFMSGPIGAEICGCQFTPDGRSLFLTVQHPGSGSPVERPRSRWPDGGAAAPRSSLVAITPRDSRRNFGA